MPKALEWKFSIVTGCLGLYLSELLQWQIRKHKTQTLEPKKCTSSGNWKGQEKAPKLFSSEISMHLSALLCPCGHYHLSAHCEQRIVMGTGKRDATYRKKKKKRREKAKRMLCLFYVCPFIINPSPPNSYPSITSL